MAKKANPNKIETQIDSKSWVSALKKKRETSANQDTTNNSEFQNNSSQVNLEKELKKGKFGSIRGIINKAVENVLNTDVAQTVSTSHANKLWSVQLLANRSKGRLDPNYGGQDNPSVRPITSVSSSVENFPEGISIRAKQNVPTDYTLSNPTTTLRKSYITTKDKVYLVNISSSPFQILELQNRPSEIKITPSSNWVDVNSMGRNNPFSIYTGGNETITLDISWYANQLYRSDDVISKCRLLESWSKADGYMASPPIIKLIWGDGDMFSNYKFVLKSATYIISNFNSVAVKPEYGTAVLQNDGSWASKKSHETYQEGKLFPRVATQSLILQRVTDKNLNHVDIIPKENLFNLQGFLWKYE